MSTSTHIDIIIYVIHAIYVTYVIIVYVIAVVRPPPRLLLLLVCSSDPERVNIPLFLPLHNVVVDRLGGDSR